MPQPYDVITMGRIGVDIYPLQTGVPLAQVDTFGKFLGGSATNVAVAAARLGRRTAVVTRTGRDAFGDYLHQALREFGVDDQWVTPVDGYPTPVTFCEIFPPDDFPLYFYRHPRAPDLQIRHHELDLDAIRAARVFWMTGTGLCAEPSRSSTQLALRARTPGEGFTVFDLDWRPMFWKGGAEDARPHYEAALAHATVAVGNLDECEVATGEREPRAAARALLAAGVHLAVVKQGPKGVLAVHRDGTEAEIPPVPVDVVNGLGAGDAFGGALCHGLLAGWELPDVMRYANAAGAIVASRLACSSAMPYAPEVTQVLTGGPVPPQPPPSRTLTEPPPGGTGPGIPPESRPPAEPEAAGDAGSSAARPPSAPGPAGRRTPSMPEARLAFRSPAAPGISGVAHEPGGNPAEHRTPPAAGPRGQAGAPSGSPCRSDGPGHGCAPGPQSPGSDGAPDGQEVPDRDAAPHGPALQSGGSGGAATGRQAPERSGSQAPGPAEARRLGGAREGRSAAGAITTGGGHGPVEPQGSRTAEGSPGAAPDAGVSGGASGTVPGRGLSGPQGGEVPREAGPGGPGARGVRTHGGAV